MKMKRKYQLLRIILAGMITLVSLAGSITMGFAQDGEELAITVVSDDTCGEVQFTVSWSPDEAESYLFNMDFGDGDSTGLITTEESSLILNHTYINQGEFELYIEVIEAKTDGRSDTYSQNFILEGPEVTLNSIPFPPMFIAEEDGQVEFSAEVFGGTPEYSYLWDLNGDGNPEPDEGSTAAHTYSDVGEYSAQVTVTDGCGFTGSASIPVVVADEDDVCHPMAQKIADGISDLLPEQKDGDYTCEDIYTMFDNEEEENNLGFGRMWMAYKLAESIDMIWEEILAWHLDESGWGTLLQLNRYSELLDDYGVGDLVTLVMSEDYTINDVRTAARTSTRYEADFEDALERVADGATTGELTQFYKLAAELEADTETLDTYLADGMTLAELKHSANFADRMEVEWTEIADARVAADNWGALNQAYNLATDEISAVEILALGVQEYRKSLVEEKKAAAAQEEKQAQKEEQKTQQNVEKLAEQYSAEHSDVMNLLNGECEGDWACVRKALREQSRTDSEGLSEKDNQTALQIASKYGYSEGEVLDYYQNECGMDWSCTRTHFRNLFMENRETGKPNK
jgi:PKD repeat protein